MEAANLFRVTALNPVQFTSLAILGATASGVSVERGASVTFTGVSFSQNAGQNGGAVNSSGNVVFSGCNFTNNVAQAYGGAIYVLSSSIEVRGSYFISNRAGQRGGAIHLSTSSPSVVAGNTFDSNQVTAPYPNETLAGALYAFGRVLLAGNLFTGQNVAQYGGAVVLDGNITSCGPSSYTDSSASGNASPNMVYLTAAFSGTFCPQPPAGVLSSASGIPPSLPADACARCSCSNGGLCDRRANCTTSSTADATCTCPSGLNGTGYFCTSGLGPYPGLLSRPVNPTTPPPSTPTPMAPPPPSKPPLTPPPTPPPTPLLAPPPPPHHKSRSLLWLWIVIGGIVGLALGFIIGTELPWHCVRNTLWLLKGAILALFRALTRCRAPRDGSAPPSSGTRQDAGPSTASSVRASRPPAASTTVPQSGPSTGTTEIEEVAEDNTRNDNVATNYGEDVANRWREGRWKYDIFISHAGEDKTFAHWLSKAFTDIGLSAFLDEANIRGGDIVDVSMLTAVKEAPVGLALLSHHFLQKNWPIKELKIIVGQTTLLPVLYNITHEDAAREIADSPQAEPYDPREWTSFVDIVTRTAAIKNPSSSSNELPFVQFIVFSALGLCVDVVSPKVVEHSLDRVWAYRFVRRLEKALLKISNEFGKLELDQSRLAKEWSTNMQYLANTLR